MKTDKTPRTPRLEEGIARLTARKNITRSVAWKNDIKPFLTGLRNEASEAWHTTKIDDLTNEQIVRSVVSQKATVKTVDRIISRYENTDTLKRLKAELEKIEKLRETKEQIDGK